MAREGDGVDSNGSGGADVQFSEVLYCIQGWVQCFKGVYGKSTVFGHRLGTSRFSMMFS